MRGFHCAAELRRHERCLEERDLTDLPPPDSRLAGKIKIVKFERPDETAALMDEIFSFLGRFVAYPSEHAQVAHALWIVHTHLMDEWASTPRLAFLSPEPGSGKTRSLEVSATLVPNPVEAVNVTPSYLFRKVGAK